MDETQNVTGKSQAVKGVVAPGCVDDVVRLVREATQSRQPLYPYSKGLNWGYGSRSPVTDGALLVDLSRMNRIRNADQISPAHPVAVIEPGVTQRQLADFLRDRCPDLTFNVTGAGEATSILGNALDRGVGYFGPRKDDVFGLEVVTGRGEVLNTGFRRLGEDSPLAHCHPYGIGPIVDGLFFQGNFGIVTSACFRLYPRRPKEIALSLGLKTESGLPAFIDALAGLKRDGLLTSVTHIGNHARTASTLSYGITKYLTERCGYSPERAAAEAERAIRVVARDEWTGLASITGNARQVRAALSEVRARLGALARVMVVTDALLDVGYAVTHALRMIPFARANAAAISAIRPLHALALGKPTDVAIDNLLWKFGRPDLPAERLDESPVGLLFVNPALPLDGRTVRDVVDGMKAVAASHRHTLYMTLNIETPTSMVAVINLLFDRSSAEEADRAHRCADALLDFLRDNRLEVYRARADMMDRVARPDDPYWQTIRRLKDVFDPLNLISPGRYNLRD